MKKSRINKDKIPEKANRILNGILVVVLLVLFRVWHLAVLQHDEKLQEARRPQEREVIERAERATICDRFHIPLATNQVQYNASVSYGLIRELPRWVWQKDKAGKRIKYFFRKEYITKLAQKLGEELHLDPGRLEDIIHSKAAILGNVPCLVKEDITESEYFRLKMLEKDWPGIQAEIAAKRCYPLGPVGGEILGFIGPISQNEYRAITGELHELRECISLWEEGDLSPFPDGYHTIEEVKERLNLIEKKAYTINDLVGKTGIEAAFDENLRGLRGKHIYLSDIRGNFIRELPGSEEPKPGSPITLSLSAELQAYAERLLAEYDQEAPSARPSAIARRSLMPEYQPWIKGGSIVVMDPSNGQIYAMASFPRFDPNDFIRTGNVQEGAEKNVCINRWLETEEHIASVWDLKQPLTRERYHYLTDSFYEEAIELNWENYLKFILPPSSPVRQTAEKMGSVFDAVKVQHLVEELLSYFETEDVSISPSKIFDSVYLDEDNVLQNVTITLQEKDFIEEKKCTFKEEIKKVCNELKPYFACIPLNYEKLLLVDLYRICLDASRFSPCLVRLLGEMTLGEYREASARMVVVNEALCDLIRALYEENDFNRWREESFKDFLAQKRLEEKRAGRKYARPYIEYLDKEQKDQFNEFWGQHRWDFLALFLTGETDLSGKRLDPYLGPLKTWHNELMKGAHRALPWVIHYQRLNELVGLFERKSVLIPFLRSLRSFSELDRPLLGKYSGLRGMLERHLAAAFYPSYGFGFARSYAFRQAASIGSIFKLVPAYEALRQRYLQKNYDLNPLTIIDDKHRSWGKEGMWNVGYTLDGKTIPIYYRGGRLPRSEHPGVGKIDLIGAIEASSNPYFSMLAGDVLEDPEDMCKAAATLGYGCKTGIDLPGEYGGHIPKDVSYNRTGLYAMAIGQHTMIGTPLQTAVMMSSLVNGGEILKPQIILAEKEVKRKVFLPEKIQGLLLKGLKQVVMGEKGTARSLKTQFSNDLVKRIIGKTSTAEVTEKYSLDGSYGRLKSKVVWFGAVSYESQDFSKPELVVVVYLKHGDWGRDAAPLAVKVIQKWHEIKTRQAH